MAALSWLGELAKKNWKEARPEMYRDLEQAGNLDKALLWAQEKATEELVLLIQQGVPHFMAQELATQKLMLPTEKEQPILNPDEEPFIPIE